jgi:hypothetical protein
MVVMAVQEGVEETVSALADQELLVKEIMAELAALILDKMVVAVVVQALLVVPDHLPAQAAREQLLQLQGHQ